MSKMHAKWLQRDTNSLAIDLVGNLAVKLQEPSTSLLESTSDGIRIVPNSVIKPDGSVAFTANQSMGGNRVTNMSMPLAEQDATSKVYVDELFNTAVTRSTQVDVITLTSTDVANKYIELSYPVSELSEVDLDIVHGSVQRPNQDFRIDSTDRKILRWSSQGLDGQVESGDTFIISYPRTVSIAAPTVEVSGLTRIYGDMRFDASSVDAAKTAVGPLRFMGVHSSVAFDNALDGGIVFTLPLSDQYVQASDIRFRLNYGVPEADATEGAAVTLVGEVYVTDAGETATLGSPTYTYIEELVIGADNNILLSSLASDIKVPGSVLDGANKVVTLRIYRDTSAPNNYASKFCLVSLSPQQVVS